MLRSVRSLQFGPFFLFSSGQRYYGFPRTQCYDIVMAGSGGKSGQSKGADQLISLAAGGIAGGVEATATYPFEFAKTRAQLRGGGSARNPFKVVGQVYQQEGLKALYKGCSSLVVGSIAKDAVRFFTFDTIKEAFKDPETGRLSSGRSLLAGMSAGIVASITAVTPTERLKTALIDDARNEKRFHSAPHAIKLLVQENGLILGLYRGFVGTTLKQATATSVRLGSYNIIKQLEQDMGINQGTATNFINGSVAGTITVYTTQPFDTLKTRGQSSRGVNLTEAFRSILQDGGIRGFWSGSTMRLGRVVFAGGILFTTYEKASAVLYALSGKAKED